MKLLFAIMMLFTHWYYIPADSPSMPVEIESIDLNLKKDEFAATFFSLTNGEAALLQQGSGENILVNTGGSGTKEQLDKLLKLYNVSSISSIILTTNEECCIKNLDWLISEYHVKQLIVSKSAAEKIKHEMKNFEETALHIWGQGTKKQVLPMVDAEAIYVGEAVFEGMDLSVKFLNHRILFMSSVSPNAEKKLLSQNLQDVNIIKIPGFAAEPTISEQLIQHIDPQIAVIFQSEKIKPSSDFLKLLNDAWIDVYFTKKHGTVSVKFTDVNYEIITILNEEELK